MHSRNTVIVIIFYSLCFETCNLLDTQTIEWTEEVTHSYFKKFPKNKKLPFFFDARVKWGFICPSIGHVKNQGLSRSSWAITVADVMTDRRCIRSNGKETFPLSSMMLMSCCTNCGGSNRHVKILNAWEYARDKGLVNGSIKMNEYSPKDGCQPFSFKPLSAKNVHKMGTRCVPIPACELNSCTNLFYKSSIGAKPLDTYKIASFQSFNHYEEEDIMRNLIENGPLQMTFPLFEDFRFYDGSDNCSIYFHYWGKNEGEHAAKLIGWGTENHIDYWLLVNSFSVAWGCNGTFKIPRVEATNANFINVFIAPSDNGSNSFFVTNIYIWILIILFYTN